MLATLPYINQGNVNFFISIGSLGARGESDIVEDVHVKNCTIIETLNGVRIKTKQVISSCYFFLSG